MIFESNNNECRVLFDFNMLSIIFEVVYGLISMYSMYVKFLNKTKLSQLNTHNNFECYTSVK